MRLASGVRLGHVNLEVSSLARARAFYDVLLSELGFRRRPNTGPHWIGYHRRGTDLWLTVSRPRRARRARPRVPTNGAKDPISDHLGFWVPSERQLLRLERRLIARGLRPVYALDRTKVWGGYWYISDAWSDPDHNVLELYTLRRGGVAPTDRPKRRPG
jgi:catechol 2,3-dioxygenase-like lactoylglutathione lyase family enzyme